MRTHCSNASKRAICSFDLSEDLGVAGGDHNGIDSFVSLPTRGQPSHAINGRDDVLGSGPCKPGMAFSKYDGFSPGRRSALTGAERIGELVAGWAPMQELIDLDASVARPSSNSSVSLLASWPKRT